MTMPIPIKALRILVLLAVAAFATPVQKAGAETCTEDPWFFCTCARMAAQQCWQDYEACGGFFVEGCSAAYSQCRHESGIDQCE